MLINRDIRGININQGEMVGGTETEAFMSKKFLIL
jgi:hypothetical protein